MLIIISVMIAIGHMFIKEQNNVDPNYGKTIVIKQDTCIVVGFDYETQQYILDDGRQVSEEIIKLFEIKN